MTRWVLLGAVLVSLPVLTDAAVDFRFRAENPDRNVGYSQEDREEMVRLIERSRTKPKPQLAMAESDQRAALQYLWGDQ